jgi:hypothetical protein
MLTILTLLVRYTGDHDVCRNLALLVASLSAKFGWIYRPRSICIHSSRGNCKIHSPHPSPNIHRDLINYQSCPGAPLNRSSCCAAITASSSISVHPVWSLGQARSFAGLSDGDFRHVFSSSATTSDGAPLPAESQQRQLHGLLYISCGRILLDHAP